MTQIWHVGFGRVVLPGGAGAQVSERGSRVGAGSSCFLPHASVEIRSSDRRRAITCTSRSFSGRSPRRRGRLA